MNALIQSDTRTMSSREIADLVEVRHDSVKRSIERLATDLIENGIVKRGAVIQLPPLVKVTNAQGQGVTEYRIGKRDSYVIVAQLSPAFTARLVDRWQELEAAAVEPKFVIPTTLSGALRLAADQADQIEKQILLLEAQKPAVEFVERYTQADGNKGFREVAKLLGANERHFRAFLSTHSIMYRLNGEWMPYAHHQQAGRFDVKTGIGDNDRAFNQAVFTPKGIQWIAAEWSKYQAALAA